MTIKYSMFKDYPAYKADKAASKLWRKLITGDYGEDYWIKAIAKALQAAYNRGEHEGASNPYC